MLATGGKGIRIGAILRRGAGCQVCRMLESYRFDSRSERSAPGLFVLDRLEERLEVALPEAPRPVSLDDLEEEGGAILDRLGEDLEQVPFLVAVDEDPQVGDLTQVLVDLADAIREEL